MQVFVFSAACTQLPMLALDPLLLTFLLLKLAKLIDHSEHFQNFQKISMVSGYFPAANLVGKFRYLKAPDALKMHSKKSPRPYLMTSRISKFKEPKKFIEILISSGWHKFDLEMVYCSFIATRHFIE